jgi:hypothetical protein
VRGAYPGSFDPLTVAHLAVAEAAVHQLGLTRLDLVISVDPLGKVGANQTRPEDRLAVIEAVGRRLRWIGAATTGHRLITDIAGGYDAIVVGADKWAQVLDPAWYGDSTDERDRALASLPTVGLAPRATTDPPATGPVALPTRVVELDLHPVHREVSASSVRAGRREWMAPEAAAFDERTGAWSDRPRYERWVSGRQAAAGR